ncbi:MAG: mannose-6-phosphate isomerase, class [Actinomycetota bacterium]
MFEIVNTPRDYAWGSTSAIAGLLGTVPSGLPEAELWLGDHPACPARVKSTGQSLIAWGASHPERFGTGPLPFLLKVLAAESPLSIQAHPTRVQAEHGFAAENAAGLDPDSPNRNFRDANHKPEVIVALSDFSALCGFRPSAERASIIAELIHQGIPGSSELASAVTAGLDVAVEWMLTRGDGMNELVEALSAGIRAPSDAVVDDAFETARVLSGHFPGDPGIGVSILLNHVMLRPGEALFLPAGNIHAYLQGLGIEVMAASDNVLRGGLTSKHVDIPELLDVLDFRELHEPRLDATESNGVRTFDPGLDDFILTEIEAHHDVHIAISGPAIAIAVAGEVMLYSEAECGLPRGSSVFIEAGETVHRVTGTGRIFVAHSPTRNFSKT